MTGDHPVTYTTAAGLVVTVELGEDGWTWRANAGNGQPAALGARAHARKDNALRAARRVHPPLTLDRSLTPTP